MNWTRSPLNERQIHSRFYKLIFMNVKLFNGSEIGNITFIKHNREKSFSWTKNWTQSTLNERQIHSRLLEPVSHNKSKINTRSGLELETIKNKNVDPVRISFKNRIKNINDKDNYIFIFKMILPHFITSSYSLDAWKELNCRILC